MKRGAFFLNQTLKAFGFFLFVCENRLWNSILLGFRYETNDASGAGCHTTEKITSI